VAIETQTRSASLSGLLNKQVANMGVLYIKLHHYHWYVKGSGFFTLHQKFEELYDEVAKFYDDLAERMLALGGRPVSNMEETLKLSSLTEAKGGETAEMMVKQLADDFTKVADELRQGIAQAEKEGDHPTADLLISIRDALEKHCWMLSAYLGNNQSEQP